MYLPAVVRKLSKAAPALAVTAALTLVIAGAGAAAGQISLTAIDATYEQHFDGLAASGSSDLLPEGWALSEAGTTASTRPAPAAPPPGTPIALALQGRASARSERCSAGP
jgi:hypothetical protein